MFNNLMAEFTRRNLKPWKEVANTLGCTERTARNKLQCSTPFTVTEAKKIAKKYFKDMSLDYLFATDTAQPQNNNE